MTINSTETVFTTIWIPLLYFVGHALVAVLVGLPGIWLMLFGIRNTQGARRVWYAITNTQLIEYSQVGVVRTYEWNMFVPTIRLRRTSATKGEILLNQPTATTLKDILRELTGMRSVSMTQVHNIDHVARQIKYNMSRHSPKADIVNS
jgi:hypothetical protein